MNSLTILSTKANHENVLTHEIPYLLCLLLSFLFRERHSSFAYNELDQSNNLTIFFVTFNVLFIPVLHKNNSTLTPEIFLNVKNYYILKIRARKFDYYEFSFGY